MAKAVGKLLGRFSLAPSSPQRIAPPPVTFPASIIRASHSSSTKGNICLLKNVINYLQDFAVIRQAWQSNKESSHYHPPVILHFTHEDYGYSQVRMSILSRSNINAFHVDEDKIRQLSSFDDGKPANTCSPVKMIEGCLDTLYEVFPEAQRDADRRNCWDYPASALRIFNDFHELEKERIFSELDILTKVLTVAHDTILVDVESHVVVEDKKERNLINTPEELGAYLYYKMQEVPELRDDLAMEKGMGPGAYKEHYLENNHMSRDDGFSPDEWLAKGSRARREWDEPDL